MRLILTFFFCLILTCGSIAFIVFSSVQQSSNAAFLELAVSQLERVEERVNTFMEPGAMSVKYLAGTELVQNSRGRLTSYLDTTETTTLLYANHPPYEQRIYDEFIRIHQSNDNYGLVFMANNDGQYAQAPEGSYKAPGYDPRLRSWYEEAIQDPDAITITSPYLTTGGGMVCSIMTKTYDPQGLPLGLLGVDYSLQSLTRDLNGRHILQTGYLVIFDTNGRIITDGRHPEYIAMEPEDYPAVRQAMAAAPEGTLDSTGEHGIDKYIVLHTMDTTQWKIAVVFDKSELLASSYALLRTILLTSGIIFLLAFVVLVIISRGIVRPIEELIDASAIISSGEYETSESVRQNLQQKLSVTGQGESKKLSEALRLMLDTLQERIEAAQQASRAKSDFLSNMSHEMRTPMNAIIGMTAIGKSSAGLARKDYCLNKIEDASTHLLGVINDILDMSKIEANKLELASVSFNFEKLLQKVVNVINFRVDERGQKFSVHIDPRIPNILIGDDQRLAQVITNLLGNAVKFTPEDGSIQLYAHLEKIEGDLCTLRLAVTDTGIGISPEQQARLFTSFEQAESNTSRKFGGTGLGLAISKRIVELMGGKIWIESALGKGSTFAFTITVKKGVQAQYRVLGSSVNWSNIRILMVDDAAELREYFAEIVGRLGVACDTAASGEEALELIAAKGHYDVYFIDWKMPGLNGIELARRIKENHGETSVVTMISSTEWSVIEDEAQAAGVDKFLPKPLFPSTITDCINECLGAENLLAAVEERPKTIDSFKGSRIILAEDVEINREIVLALLEPTELAIDCAENGAAALKLFRAHPERYDMIFMDVQMPEMDGYEATRQIRALPVPQAGQIPIVAMTANVFREDVEKCLAAGMNSHLGKPLDLDEVLEQLRRYLPESLS
jgi:signal transduction histidine kinase/DNA-binding response OmpR family regulator